MNKGSFFSPRPGGQDVNVFKPLEQALHIQGITGAQRGLGLDLPAVTGNLVPIKSGVRAGSPTVGHGLDPAH